MQKDPKAPTRPNRARISLVDLGAEDEAPQLSLYVLDRANNLIHTAGVDEEGEFDVPADALKNAHYVAVGPASESFHQVERRSLAMYRAERFREIVNQGIELEFSKGEWLQWLFFRRCVRGRVSHCYPHHWLIRDLRLQAAPTTAGAVSLAEAAQSGLSLSRLTKMGDLALAQPRVRPSIPFRCEPVCDGLVEVYERQCCCTPWVIEDPRLPGLFERLEVLVRDVPILKWPPRPEPDPPPFQDLAFLKSGALDEGALKAQQDLLALRSLPKERVPAYIEARPHLFCFGLYSCQPPVKVGQGFINPDGKFRVCWLGGPSSLTPARRRCHYEYAYVVKQVINGATVTIYNGVAANAWFGYEDEAALVSYHSQAVGCRHNEFEGTGAFVLLQDIGAAESHRLQTPDAAGWDRVAPFDPDGNAGLADPAPSPDEARGRDLDRNWGGVLYLRYHFSESMRTIGAKYYRISFRPTDGSGAPTGAPVYLSAGLSWKKYVVAGTNINVETQSLGPNSAGSGASRQNNLFLIPYDAEEQWQSGQYHGYLDTTQTAHGRYLVTLEVFNDGGERLRPMGAGGPGLEKEFTFRRWHQPADPTTATVPVPYAALTHLFWWDNHKAEAEIVDLRNGGDPSTSECQFLSGTDSSEFSVGYRAYHPTPRFFLNHSLWWRRGLGGPTGHIIGSSPDNVGRPPDPVGVSPTHTFSHMLGGELKCSFTLNLQANVKTFNGFSTVDSLSDSDQAAFALDRSGPPPTMA